MKTKVWLALVPLIFNSCITTSSISNSTGVPMNELEAIPKGAKDIIIRVENGNSVEIYGQLKRAIIERSHRISNEDKENYYLTTEGKDIGESTLQRMVAAITINGNDCNVKLSTEYKPGMEATMNATALSGINMASDWTEARYETGRPAIAFVESYIIAKKIVNGEITFK